MTRNCRFLAITLVGLAGCRDQPPTVVVPANPGTVVVPAETTPQVVRRPVVVDPDPVTKDVYVTGMREKLAIFDRQYVQWSQMREAATGQRRAALTTPLGELKGKRDSFAQEINRLATDVSVAWVRTKGNCDRAFIGCREAFERAAPVFGG